MKDLAVVYMSKYGHTKQYADWLKEDFDADVITAASFNPTKLLAYKLTVFASGVYGDKLQIMEWFKKNSVGVNPAKIMIAAVSWYTNDSEEAKEKLIKENYPENFKNVVPLFVINSGIDKKKINAMEKVQLVASQVAIDKHESRSSDDINALAIIKGYSDQTSKDNLKSISAAIENFLHPPKNVPKAAAAEEKTPKPVAPAAEAKPAPAAETAAKPAPEPVKKPAPAPVPKGGHEVTSLDDALAALGSGNILLNKPPMHRHDPEPPKAEAPEQPKAEAAASSGIEVPEVPTLADVVNKQTHSEPAPAPAPTPVKAEEPKKESNTYAGMEIPEVPTLADIVNKKAHSEPAPASAPAPTPVKAEEPEKESNTYAGMEIPEVPTLADVVNKKAHSEPAPAPAPAPTPVKAEEPEKESNTYAGMEIPEVPTLADIVNKKAHSEPAPTPVKAAEPEKESSRIAEIEIPEVPNLADAVSRNSRSGYDAFKADDEIASEGKRIAGIEISDDVVMSISDDIEEITKPAEAPKPVTLRRPEPVKPAEPAAPARNSYLEFFSKKNKPAEEPKPAAEEPKPVYEAPKPAPAPVSAVDDFDFDILGNESSTAEKVSSRALNAVEALAKAKAKAAAEANAPKQEDADNSGPTTYDVISNSVGMDIPEPAAPVYEAPAEEKPVPAPVYEEEEENEPVYEAPVVQSEPEEPKAPEFSEDDVFMFSNDNDYDINDIDPSKLLEPEEPQKEHQRLDFKKLQEEIEASIEVNKKIRDKEKFRNMRESERRAFEEEQQKPKKGIKQPEDPDIFFKRPGKDYYASDSMPEIRFNRHKHDQ